MKMRKMQLVEPMILALLLVPRLTDARWMNPYNGRFLTMDSSGGRRQDPLSLHKYVYCQDNPINLFDPTGLEVAVYSHLVKVGIIPTVFFYHTNIRMYPDDTNNISTGLLVAKDPANSGWRLDNGRPYIVLGAGDDGRPGWKLKSDLNRQEDQADRSHDLEFVVAAPGGLSNDQFILRLLQANALYPDTVNYAVFPAIARNGRNSNSYVVGLLQAVTEFDYSTTRTKHLAPGWGKPVPTMWFLPIPGPSRGLDGYNYDLK